MQFADLKVYWTTRTVTPPYFYSNVHPPPPDEDHDSATYVVSYQVLHFSYNVRTLKVQLDTV